jgi:hypothetical protein
MKDNAVE